MNISIRSVSLCLNCGSGGSEFYFATHNTQYTLYSTHLYCRSMFWQCHCCRSSLKIQPFVRTHNTFRKQTYCLGLHKNHWMAILYRLWVWSLGDDVNHQSLYLPSLSPPRRKRPPAMTSGYIRLLFSLSWSFVSEIEQWLTLDDLIRDEAFSVVTDICWHSAGRKRQSQHTYSPWP